MQLKTYRAASIADAIADIKRDLGADAVILHTRSYRRGAILGFGGRRIFEITASAGVNVAGALRARSRAAPPAPDPARPPRADSPDVRRAYASNSARTAPAPPSPDPVRDVARLALAAPQASPGAGANPRASDDSSALAGVSTELASIRRMVSHVMKSAARAPRAALPDALFSQYLSLLEGAVAEELADEIISAVRDELPAPDLADERAVRRAVLARLESLIPAAGPTPTLERPADGRPLTIALVGPTGVGKTTTLAKLAAIYKLRQGKRVGLVTCDTYRIAAVDQLRTYANIIGLDLRVALTPKDMAAAAAAHADRDVVLIDTAGRSQRDSARLAELRAFLDAARPHETHLVLSGAASEPVILESAQRFAPIGADRVIFTKLDEMVNFGVLVNAARRIGVRLSFLTTGQEVPDHIEPARPDRLARLVLEGGDLR